MSDSKAHWPTYDEPPLVEVAMSVQFDPPRGLNAAHLGAFWSQWRHEYPNVRATGRIAWAEDFDLAGQWLPPAMRVALSDDVECRLQMASEDDQWMFQVQADRLVVNWRKRTEQYPRFGATLERFASLWQKWCEFLSDLKHTAPAARLWDLTYVNRVPRGDLWAEPSQWPTVFPGLWGARSTDLTGSQLRGLRGQWVWDRFEPRARLYAEAMPAKNADPPQDLLILNLIARGPIENALAETSSADNDSWSAIVSGMNVGHQMIVFTFDAIPSAAAKRHWKRHDDID